MNEYIDENDLENKAHKIIEEDNYSFVFLKDRHEELSFIVLEKGIFGCRFTFHDYNVEQNNFNTANNNTILYGIINDSNIQRIAVNDETVQITDFADTRIWVYLEKGENDFEKIITITTYDENDNSIDQEEIMK